MSSDLGEKGKTWSGDTTHQEIMLDWESDEIIPLCLRTLHHVLHCRGSSNRTQLSLGRGGAAEGNVPVLILSQV